jgi:hypothetical protein
VGTDDEMMVEIAILVVGAVDDFFLVGVFVFVDFC